MGGGDQRWETRPSYGGPRRRHRNEGCTIKSQMGGRWGGDGDGGGGAMAPDGDPMV